MTYLSVKFQLALEDADDIMYDTINRMAVRLQKQYNPPLDDLQRVWEGYFDKCDFEARVLASMIDDLENPA